VSDEDRLRERLLDRAAGVPDLADLDDVAARLGRRRLVRERRLALVAALALAVGVASGVALVRDDHDGGTVAVGNNDATTATPASTSTTTAYQPWESLPAPGPEQPADPDAARRDIERAFDAAFSGDASPQQWSEAIEHGDTLTGVFDGLRNSPVGEVVRSARTVVDGVVFLSSARAVVEFRGVIDGVDTLIENYGEAVLTERGWQVSRASYCDFVRAAQVYCPE
jgi:hypothetical protein